MRVALGHLRSLSRLLEVSWNQLRDETLIIGGSHLKVVCVHPCFCFYDILICVLYTYELVFLTLNNSKLHYTNLEKSLKKARESFYFLIVLINVEARTNSILLCINDFIFFLFVFLPYIYSFTKCF